MDAKPVNNLSALSNPKAAKGGRAREADRVEGDAAIAKANTKAEQGRNYDVALSPQAREMAESRHKAMEIARNTPDVREDRVAELRKKVREGKYKVNAEGIADGMLKEAVRDEVALSMHDEAKQRT